MTENKYSIQIDKSKTVIRNVKDIPDEELVEICRDHLPKISEKTGISMTALNSLSGKYQMKVFINFNSVNCSLSEINRIVGEGIYDNIIKDCAKFMNIEKSVLDNLDEYTQEQVIGSFDMQRELVPDEQLRAELFELMNNHGRLRGAENGNQN